MSVAISIDPTAWPSEMAALTPMQQLYAVYRARGLSDVEAALAAGFSGATRAAVQRQAWQVERKPHVARAIRALKAHHAQSHKETIYARPSHVG